jgi:hypothetical protein
MGKRTEGSSTGSCGGKLTREIFLSVAQFYHSDLMIVQDKELFKSVNGSDSFNDAGPSHKR